MCRFSGLAVAIPGAECSPGVGIADPLAELVVLPDEVDADVVEWLEDVMVLEGALEVLDPGTPNPTFSNS
jgi:hypothetical protein